MRISEEAVFKWVLIVGAAAASVIGLTLLTRPMVGAFWGLALVCARPGLCVPLVEAPVLKKA